MSTLEKSSDDSCHYFVVPHMPREEKKNMNKVNDDSKERQRYLLVKFNELRYDSMSKSEVRYKFQGMLFIRLRSKLPLEW